MVVLLWICSTIIIIHTWLIVKVIDTINYVVMMPAIWSWIHVKFWSMVKWIYFVMIPAIFRWLYNKLKRTVRWVFLTMALPILKWLRDKLKNIFQAVTVWLRQRIRYIWVWIRSTSTSMLQWFFKAIQHLLLWICRQVCRDELEGEKNALILVCEEQRALAKRYNEMCSEWQWKYKCLTQDVGKKLASDLAKDETRSENISQQCRPSVLHEIYTTLSFQQASNLKKAMPAPGDFVTEQFWEAYLARFICTLFITSGDEMAALHDAQLTKLNGWLRQPASQMWLDHRSASNAQLHQAMTSDSLPDYFRIKAIQFIKQNSNDVIVEQATLAQIFNTCLTNVEETMVNTGLIEKQDGRVERARRYLLKAVLDKPANKDICLKQLASFSKSVCSLAWNMAIQQPAMKFETPGISEVVNIDTHMIIPNKKVDMSRMHDVVIDVYLEPDLTHGDKVIQQGRILVRDSTKPCEKLLPDPVDARGEIFDLIEQHDELGNGRDSVKQTADQPFSETGTAAQDEYPCDILSLERGKISSSTLKYVKAVEDRPAADTSVINRVNPHVMEPPPNVADEACKDAPVIGLTDQATKHDHIVSEPSENDLVKRSDTLIQIIQPHGNDTVEPPAVDLSPVVM